MLLKCFSLLETKKVDILLTDIMMPGMNGAELSKAVHQKFPEIKYWLYL
ncbi:MAG: response regulator [Chitinophagaceae bacterium]|nr:response regulator [Chitinophagaceae bacterium]